MTHTRAPRRQTAGPLGWPRDLRLTLRPFEAAVVLQVTERDIRRMLARGELHDASLDRVRRVDAEQLAEAVARRVDAGDLSPLALYLLEEARRGLVRLPRA